MATAMKKQTRFQRINKYLETNETLGCACVKKEHGLRRGYLFRSETLRGIYSFDNSINALTYYTRLPVHNTYAHNIHTRVLRGHLRSGLFPAVVDTRTKTILSGRYSVYGYGTRVYTRCRRLDPVDIQTLDVMYTCRYVYGNSFGTIISNFFLVF